MIQLEKKMLNNVASYKQYWRGNPVAAIIKNPSPTPPGPDYSEPFYVQPLEANTTIHIFGNSAVTSNHQYSLSKNGPWTDIPDNPNPEWTADKVLTLDVPAGTKIYIRVTASSWFDQGDIDHILCDKNHNVGGNIMSLLYGSSFTGNERSFPFNEHGYTDVFNSLFYNENFELNEYLINAGDLLLPATTLIDMCYYNMFNGCCNMITTPELPATTLAEGCYQNMFVNCYSITGIRCLAEDISAEGCLDWWLSGAAASGTFTKKAGVTYPSGESGIPSGWTVVEV